MERFPWKKSTGEIEFEESVLFRFAAVNQRTLYTAFSTVRERRSLRRTSFEEGLASLSFGPQWSNYAIKAANSDKDPEELKKNSRVTNRIPACGRVSSRRGDLASPS